MHYRIGRYAGPMAPRLSSFAREGAARNLLLQKEVVIIYPSQIRTLDCETVTKEASDGSRD